MKKTYSSILILVGLLHYAQTVPPIYNGQNSDLSGVNENYIYVRNYLEPTSVSNPKAKQIQNILFFDGLGKPNQNVTIHASPTGNDLVTHIPYDNFGRQAEDWLPVPMSSQNGNIQVPPSTSGYYKTSSGSVDALIYGKKNLENSPLDRLRSYAGPGTDWSGKQSIYNYYTNNDAEVYKFTTTSTLNNGVISSVLNSQLINYPEGALYKTVINDEDGHEVTEFKNEQGQTLLTRKKQGFSYLSTYYVYNEYNQLAFVIPPLASQKIAAANGVTPDILAGLIYQYRYDGWNRLTESKTPGVDWKYMVYDQMDRLVMSQDINLRSQGKWLFTKYDALGRIAYTGLLNSSGDRQAQQAAINTNPGETRSSSGFTDLEGSTIYYTNGNTYPQSNMTVLSVNYYDTYPPGSPSNSSGVVTQSYLLASFVKNIENNSWTKNYIYYDEKGRAIADHSINHLNGYTKKESTLTFSGVPSNILTHHKKDANSQEVTISESFTYDHQDRLIKHTHQINGGAEETLAEYIYNELGQLQNKNVGNGIQSLAYRYNTRGALTHINDPNSLNNKLFGYELKYTNPQSNNAIYSGNIAEIDWATQSDGILRRYDYSYDGVNRLSGGLYIEPNATNPNVYYFNESAEYDSNGNILYLSRFRKSQNSTFAEYADGLSYTYDNNSNRLVKVKDTSSNGAGYPIGENTITYDDSGNMKNHLDKGINTINYNFLNLPNNISVNPGTKKQGTIQYIYRADGTKVAKTYTGTLNSITTTEYIDGFQYSSYAGLLTPITPSGLQFVPTSEGYYDFTKSKYIYNYTDHLGNVRVSYLKGTSGAAEIIEENNYYPFGLKHEGYNNIGLGNPNYKYGYLENELQETGMYDMNARSYMPDLGRFVQHDPLSSLSLDAYGYAFNNPIAIKDPTGLFGESANCPPDCSIPPNSPGGANNPRLIEEVVVGNNPGGGYLPAGFYYYPWGGYGYGDYSGGSNSVGPVYNITNAPGEDPLAWLRTRNMPSFQDTYTWGSRGNWFFGAAAALSVIKGGLNAERMYGQGIRRGITANYQLTGRNLSQFGSMAPTKASFPTSSLAKWGGIAGKVSVGIGIVLDYRALQKGEISEGKFYFNSGVGLYGLTAVGAVPSILYFGVDAFYPGGWTGNAEHPGAFNDQSRLNQENSFNPYWQIWPGAMKQ
ncbi:cell well associated RhsD protein [Chryseobacterium sp. StRB126]|uniref:DUF6443 domain-containing protein n=2 Tax=Bacteria TaxID=2 RepID=UPI0004E98ABC|nr:DUF6443 domain-containing protein [Chryseobacterium sp. StRB126]BAP32263.1 cell well associated RhsD protein [Chryseobacterium sp. StRB126]